MSGRTFMVLILTAMAAMAIASRIDNDVMACFGFLLFCLPGAAVIIQSEVK